MHRPDQFLPRAQKTPFLIVKQVSRSKFTELTYFLFSYAPSRALASTEAGPGPQLTTRPRARVSWEKVKIALCWSPGAAHPQRGGQTTALGGSGNSRRAHPRGPLGARMRHPGPGCWPLSPPSLRGFKLDLFLSKEQRSPHPRASSGNGRGTCPCPRPPSPSGATAQPCGVRALGAPGAQCTLLPVSLLVLTRGFLALMADDVQLWLSPLPTHTLQL